MFGRPDAYERVVRPHDHDMTRCTVWIVSRLRHHISRLWRFVRTKYAPSGNCIIWICPFPGSRTRRVYPAVGRSWTRSRPGQHFIDEQIAFIRTFGVGPLCKAEVPCGRSNLFLCRLDDFLTYEGQLVLACEQEGLPWSTAHLAKLKIHATGKGNAKKPEM